MNGIDLTAIVLAVIGACSSYITPKLLTRRERKKAADDAANVSWVSINNALSRELETAKAELITQAKEHDEELAAELDARDKRHAGEMKAANDRLEACQARVDDLHDRLRRRPPGS